MSDQNPSSNSEPEAQNASVTDGNSPSVSSGFSAFEVEEMAASDELQERRRRTKLALQESAHTEDSKEEEADGQVSGFRGLLREADVTPQQLGFCCLGLVVLVVLIGLFSFKGTALKQTLVRWGDGMAESVTNWEWPRFDFGGSTDSNDAETGGEDENPEPSDEGEPEDSGEDTDSGTVILVPSEDAEGKYPDFTVSVGMLLGDPLPSEGVEAITGEVLGTQIPQDEFQQQIRDLSRILQAVGTDVNLLLNQASDRRQALRDYRAELLYLNDLGLKNMQRLEDTQEELATAFDRADALQAEQEALFFDKMQVLDPFASTGALQSFIGYGQEVARLKAEYRARAQLVGYYETVLAPIETKLHDLEVNEEPLVKGIHVVEVEGSDLDLILDDSGL